MENPLNQELSQLDLTSEPRTMLTLLKGPSPKKPAETHVRNWISFGFNPNSSTCHHPTRLADRPRLVTNWKSEAETQQQIADSLDSPPPPICAQSVDSAEPLSLKSIPEEVLLPFSERELEIVELLTERQNVGLFSRLKDLLGPRWPAFEAEVLRATRPAMGDRQWIVAIRTAIEPLDLNLWVRVRGLIGADGLDHQLEPSADQHWFIQPVKVRRSSARSSDARRRIVGLLDRPSRDSFVSVFGDSDQESLVSAASHSPMAMMMEPIKEHDNSELDPNHFDNSHSSPSFQSFSDSDSDQPDQNHALALKILESPVAVDQDCSASPLSCPSHGLKYSFGQVAQHGLGLQS